MNEQNQVQIQESIPNTHYFLYRNKKYPFCFYYFKCSSQYFQKNKSMIKKTEFINLTDESIDISDDTIESFIEYVHREPITINNENVSGLNFLSKKYEIMSLLQETEKYISNHHQELVLSSLLFYQNDEKFETDSYEDILSEKLQNYIKDDRLLKLRISILHRIINKSEIKQGNQEFYDFLFKCLDNYGRNASVLFYNIDFGDLRTELVNLLLTKYSNIFDFQFLNKSILKTIYEQQNEIIKNEIENKKMYQDEINQISEIGLKKEKQNLSRIENLEKKIKNQEEKIDDLTYENRQLKIQINKNEDEIKKLKLLNDTFEKKILNIEKNIDEKIKLIKQEDKQIKTFVPNGDADLNGVFKYLSKERGNIHENNIINVSTNSFIGNSYKPENLLYSQNSKTYAARKDDKEVIVQFDFKNLEIEVSHYSIKSCGCSVNRAHVKNWIIEISNDGEKWEKIDERLNCSDVNGPYYVKTFRL